MTETASDFISQYDLLTIAFAIAMGTAARFATLRSDSRQVPSIPNGYFIHIVNGFIASSLGAVAIPALLTKEFTAVTFLVIAVQHFRDIRKQEAESLNSIDHMEFSQRGETYTDGISKTYEARNYISLLTSLGTVLVIWLIHPEGVLLLALTAAVTGAALTLCLVALTRGKRVGDICTLREGTIDIQGSTLYVDGIYVSSLLGTEAGRAMFAREGVAIVATPKSDKHRLTLENEGQRQAMLFEAVRAFGLKKFQFTRRSMADGRVVIAFVPINPNREGIIAAIRRTPVLESIRKRQWVKGNV